MATYEENLLLDEQEAIIELYEFRMGSQYERYTSFIRSITFSGNKYTAATIQRSGLKQDDKMSAIQLNLTLPYTTTLSKFIPGQPVEPIELILYRTTLSNLGVYVIFFKGLLTGVQFQDLVVSAIFEASSKVLRRKIPRFVYQSYCNHLLFDENCGLSKLAYKEEVSIDNISSTKTTLTFSGYTPPELHYYVGGMVIFGSNMRLITAHSTINQIKIHIAFDSRLRIGSTVELLPGCDGNPSTCVDKFNNLDKFLGMPYIPNSNPVTWGFK